jgi:hypothetical protein
MEIVITKLGSDGLWTHRICWHSLYGSSSFDSSVQIKLKVNYVRIYDALTENLAKGKWVILTMPKLPFRMLMTVVLQVVTT